MARDENNGNPRNNERYFYASGKKLFKKAHREARMDGLPVFWFGGKRVNTSRGYGDCINMWEGCFEQRYRK